MTKSKCPITDEEFLLLHLTAQPPVAFELEPLAAMMLLGTLQLALRHPSNRGTTAVVMRRFADDLISRLAAGDVAIEMLLRRGDNASFDVPHSDLAPLRFNPFPPGDPNR